MAVQSVPIINHITWSETAEWFHKVIAPGTIRGCGKMLEAVAGHQPITDSSRILDVGAGTGSIERALHQLYPNVAFSVLAVDLAPGMVHHLRAQNMLNVTVEVGDATALDKNLAPDDHFTHAVGSLMIQFCGERQPLVCQELFSVLEPGGVAALSISHKINMSEPWDRACRQLDPNYKPHELHDETSWKTVDPLVVAMKEAGFVDVTGFDVWMNIDCDVEEWVSFYMDGKHPMFSKYIKAWKGDPEDVRPVFEKVCREQFPDITALGAMAGIVVGRKPA